MQLDSSIRIRRLCARFAAAVLLSVLVCEYAAAGVNRWTSNGPDPDGIYPPALMLSLAGTAVDGSDVFAAGFDGVFRTKDGGRSWQDPGNAGLTTPVVWTLVRHPLRGETLYAGGAAGGTGVFRTTDGAMSWVHRGLEDQQVNRLALDPRRPDVLFAGTYQSFPGPVALGTGVWKSSDGGNTWNQASTGLPAAAFVHAFAFDPALDGVLYASVSVQTGEPSTVPPGVYRSSDRGASWSPTGLQTTIHTLAVEPGDPSTIYAGGNNAVWRSRDGGATWAEDKNGVNFAPVTALAVDPAHQGTLYGVVDGSVFRSVNSGETWQPFNSRPDTLVNALLVSPDGRTVYAAGLGVFDYTFQGPAVTLPAAASLHGIPPAYFHSDVSVFNASADREASLVATYRCLSAACPPTVRELTIPPRQTRVFEDIVATLFEQSESGGTIEFDSAEPLVVTSRLYSPSRPAPTLGMFVPGLAPDQAYPTAVLSSLSHSEDPSAGFRTNVGVYNGNDVAQVVRFTFFDPQGATIGGLLSQPVGPREVVQINDADLPVFAAGDVPSFWCLVEGDGGAPLFAYAAVIDNQSQDAIFIPGRDADAATPFGDTLLLPVAAALPGAGETFFHSDLAVVNPTGQDAEVTALYRCGVALGPCPSVERTFHLGAGEAATFDDVVTTLFDAPNTAGAIELRTSDGSGLVATSRLYTPSRPAPTVGMFVPALDQFEATPSAVLTSLSRSADNARGMRVNVGAINAFPDGQLVTFRLFASDGTLLGQISRLLGPQASVQINDVFGAIGVVGDVPSAYCLVEGDDSGPLYAYAAVIDNQSQDPIFVPGQPDPNPPPLP